MKILIKPLISLILLNTLTACVGQASPNNSSGANSSEISQRIQLASSNSVQQTSEVGSFLFSFANGMAQGFAASELFGLLGLDTSASEDQMNLVIAQLQQVNSKLDTISANLDNISTNIKDLIKDEADSYLNSSVTDIEQINTYFNGYYNLVGTAAISDYIGNPINQQRISDIKQALNISASLVSNSQAISDTANYALIPKLIEITNRSFPVLNQTLGVDIVKTAQNYNALFFRLGLQTLKALETAHVLEDKILEFNDRYGLSYGNILINENLDAMDYNSRHAQLNTIFYNREQQITQFMQQYAKTADQIKAYLPTGSWQGSCQTDFNTKSSADKQTNALLFDGKIFSTLCASNTNPAYTTYSSLDISTCQTNVVNNNNGQLACNQIKSEYLSTTGWDYNRGHFNVAEHDEFNLYFNDNYYYTLIDGRGHLEQKETSFWDGFSPDAYDAIARDQSYNYFVINSLTDHSNQLIQLSCLKNDASCSQYGGEQSDEGSSAVKFSDGTCIRLDGNGSEMHHQIAGLHRSQC